MILFVVFFVLERYRVDDVKQDTREDCYVATLRIVDADLHDSRPYYLVVENDRGIDRHAIHLRVAGTFTGAFSFYVYCCVPFIHIYHISVPFAI